MELPTGLPIAYAIGSSDRVTDKVILDHYLALNALTISSVKLHSCSNICPRISSFLVLCHSHSMSFNSEQYLEMWNMYNPLPCRIGIRALTVDIESVCPEDAAMILEMRFTVSMAMKQWGTALTNSLLDKNGLCQDEKCFGSRTDTQPSGSHSACSNKRSLFTFNLNLPGVGTLSSDFLGERLEMKQ